MESLLFVMRVLHGHCRHADWGRCAFKESEAREGEVVMLSCWSSAVDQSSRRIP